MSVADAFLRDAAGDASQTPHISMTQACGIVSATSIRLRCLRRRRPLPNLLLRQIPQVAYKPAPHAPLGARGDPLGNSGDGDWFTESDAQNGEMHRLPVVVPSPRAVH